MAGCSLAAAAAAAAAGGKNPSSVDGALGWVEERLERRNPSGRCERGVKAHTTIEIFSLMVFSRFYFFFSGAHFRFELRTARIYLAH
jgi:hypothetical protein